MQTNNTDRTSGIIAIMGLAAVFLGFIVMIVLSNLRLTAWGILILGALLLLTAFILDYRRVGSALTGHRGKFSAGTTVMVSIFVGITLVINAISFNSYQRFDFTGLSQFTLTTQTKDVLNQLDEPIRILHFTTPADPTGIDGYIVSLLTEYQNYTDQLSVETIDPDEHPDQARKYSVTQYQSVVFEKGSVYRVVTPQTIVEEAEHAFTSAILEVSGTVQKKVYFLTGHGEGNLESQAPAGYSRAKLGLMDNLYKVDTLNLRATPEIPGDTAALVIAGPTQSLTSSETEIIKRYLESGGWMMILLNPESPADIKQLVTAWGVKIEDGTVIDRDSYLNPSIDSPMVSQERNFFGFAEIYFPGATAITPQEGAADLFEMQPLAWTTSDNSWLETTFDSQRENEFNEGTEIKGPLALGVVISTLVAGEEDSGTLKQTRLIVIGDSDFAANQHFYNGNNGEFFVNSIQLLTAGKELISIEHKILPFRRLVVGPEAGRFINISSIGLLPLLVLVIGVIVWWRRR